MIKWRIGLISLSLKECEPNVHTFSRNKKMVKKIIQYFLSVPPIDETYIFLLRIFQYTADIDKRLAEKYRKDQVDNRLVEHIKDKLVIYKQFGSLSEEIAEESEKSLDVKQLEFKILSAEID